MHIFMNELHTTFYSNNNPEETKRSEDKKHTDC